MYSNIPKSDPMVVNPNCKRTIKTEKGKEDKVEHFHVQSRR